MLFNSWEFLCFLPIVLFFYYIFTHRVQNALLLIASYFFYGWWDWRFLFLILASTLVDYFAALHIYNNKENSKRKIGLISSLLMNLGALCVFKYFNFFVDSFVALGSSVGINLDTPVMRLLPPVGISFYTFQTLSYTIDVYRGNFKPTSSFLDFAVYVCYFPQLVAGPIERASSLLPQILSKRKVNLEMVRSGLLLILIGFFKKVAIADTAASAVERVFNNPSEFSSWFLLRGLYLFSIQIYGDFSGYSNIARGVSRLFGIELIENFQTPYLSKNITEFWRRWHISLSKWLKDYLYIPLGGNRKGKFNTYRNLFITMFLGGLWHGASWTFVVWGSLHGIYLAIHKFFKEKKEKSVRNNLLNKIPRKFANLILIFFTFHLVSFTWVFFRAESFTNAWHYITGILSFSGLLYPSVFWLPAVLFMFLIPLELMQNSKFDILAIRSWPRFVRAAYYLILILCLIFFSGNEIPFIYFQF